MSWRTRGLAAVGIVTAGIGVFALLAPGDDSTAPVKSSAAEPREARPAGRERATSGLVTQVPYVGTLTWRCGDGNRYITSFFDSGATVSATLVSDGKRVWKNKPIDQRAHAPGGGIDAPLAARRTQVWTLRHHHKPATIKAVVRLKFSRDTQRDCAVSHTDVSVRRPR